MARLQRRVNVLKQRKARKEARSKEDSVCTGSADGATGGEQRGEPEKPKKVARVLPLWEATKEEEDAMLSVYNDPPGLGNVSQAELDDPVVIENIIRGER